MLLEITSSSGSHLQDGDNQDIHLPNGDQEASEKEESDYKETVNATPVARTQKSYSIWRRK